MIARRRAAALLGGVMLFSVAPVVASGQEPVEQVTPPQSAEELSVLTRLDGARAAITRLQAASNRAEYERAEAERAVVAAHQELVGATRAMELAGAAVTEALRHVEASQRERLAAQVLLDADAAASYKFNGARGAALLFELMGSNGGPNEFARDLYALESVMVRRQREVARLVDDVATATRRLELFMAIRGSAYLWHRGAEESVEAAEQDAEARRADAALAEERLLAAAAAALAIELQAAQVEVALPPAPAGADIPAAGSVLEIEPILPAAPVVAPVHPGPVLDVVADDGGPTIDFAATVEQVALRRTWLADREVDLQEERDLDNAHRRAQPTLTCPVADAEFSNDWHYPRSHGRRHKGIDLLAPLGTPVLAIADGTLMSVDRTDNFDGDNDLGGIAVTYVTDVGRFYASHLDGISEGLEEGGQVSAGDVIGWVGNSGNAQGGPHHLHLGWYVGESEVNPFPTMALICVTDPAAVEVSAPAA